MATQTGSKTAAASAAAKLRNAGDRMIFLLRWPARRLLSQECGWPNLVSSYEPRGDQGTAIEQLVRGLNDAEKHQVLLGVTGSGKTFTMAKIIDSLKRPTIVLAHNKTLAAQLYHEFRGYFPQNAVEYFVSYYDYYQPEAYIAATDTYIEKESTINDEIDRMRLSATRSLFERRDVVIVASVSCIYGIGSKEDYAAVIFPIRVGMELSRDQFLSRLIDLQYSRNDIAFERGQFRVRGDTVELWTAATEDALRVDTDLRGSAGHLQGFDHRTQRRLGDHVRAEPAIAITEARPQLAAVKVIARLEAVRLVIEARGR